MLEICWFSEQASDATYGWGEKDERPSRSQLSEIQEVSFTKDKHFWHVDDDVIVADVLITWWDKFMTIKVISVNIIEFRIFCVSDKHEIADMGWSPADTRIIVRLPRSLLIKKWCGELLTIIVNNSNQRFPATAALIIRGKLDNSN